MSDNGYRQFEKDIEEMLGDEIRKNENVGIQMWSALANTDWYHPEKGYEVSYSFRSAGGLIADIEGNTDYMAWYCSGPYAEVSDLIARSLKKKGWIYDTVGPICDELGCINPATCGTPTNSGYRHVCGDHFREIEKMEIKREVSDE